MAGLFRFPTAPIGGLRAESDSAGGLDYEPVCLRFGVHKAGHMVFCGPTIAAFPLLSGMPAASLAATGGMGKGRFLLRLIGYRCRGFGHLCRLCW